MLRCINIHLTYLLTYHELDYAVRLSEVPCRQHLTRSVSHRQMSVPHVRRSTFGTCACLSEDQQSGIHCLMTTAELVVTLKKYRFRLHYLYMLQLMFWYSSES